MAFGITKVELKAWKLAVEHGEIAFLTHYWFDPRFPNVNTITKVGCIDVQRLIDWCTRHHLPPQYIHQRESYPHFDLIGPRQKEILQQEGLYSHIERFRL